MDEWSQGEGVGRVNESEGNRERERTMGAKKNKSAKKRGETNYDTKKTKVGVTGPGCKLYFQL